MKCSESLSNRVPTIIRRYIDNMKLAAYMVFYFIIFFHIILVPLLSLYMWLYVCMLLFKFVNYVFLLLYLCILSVIFSYSYCYARSILCNLFHCVMLIVLCVNVYCTTATGCQPNCR